MRVQINLDEIDIREAIADYVYSHYSFRPSPKELPIEVKNYKSEWETAAIRVSVDLVKQP